MSFVLVLVIPHTKGDSEIKYFTVFFSIHLESQKLKNNKMNKNKS